MPHLTLEYSTGLDQSHDMHALCGTLFEALAAHAQVPNPQALKIRARPCVFDMSGAAQPGQIHATLWLLPGRDAATKSDMTQMLCDTLAKALPDIGSISVDVQELNPAYTKRVL